jgi:hypothetical protein
MFSPGLTGSVQPDSGEHLCGRHFLLQIRETLHKGLPLPCMALLQLRQEAFFQGARPRPLPEPVPLRAIPGLDFDESLQSAENFGREVGRTDFGLGWELTNAGG